MATVLLVLVRKNNARQDQRPENFNMHAFLLQMYGLLKSRVCAQFVNMIAAILYRRLLLYQLDRTDNHYGFLAGQSSMFPRILLYFFHVCLKFHSLNSIVFHRHFQ